MVVISAHSFDFNVACLNMLICEDINLAQVIRRKGDLVFYCFVIAEHFKAMVQLFLVQISFFSQRMPELVRLP